MLHVLCIVLDVFIILLGIYGIGLSLQINNFKDFVNKNYYSDFICDRKNKDDLTKEEQNKIEEIIKLTQNNQLKKLSYKVWKLFKKFKRYSKPFYKRY